MTISCMACSLFFFQAEDGIRYLTVTGFQTCALPISGGHLSLRLRAAGGHRARRRAARAGAAGEKEAGQEVRRHRRTVAARRRQASVASAADLKFRSGEGRGGEEGRSRWSPDHLKKKK